MLVRTHCGLQPIADAEIPPPSDPEVVVHSTRVEDYKRWAPIIRCQEDRFERFCRRFTADVLVPRYGHDAIAQRNIDDELLLEYERTVIAWDLDRRRRAEKFNIDEFVPFRKSEDVLENRFRMITADDLVTELETHYGLAHEAALLAREGQTAPPEVLAHNARVRTSARATVADERADEVTEARQRREQERVAALAAERRLREIGPNGETEDTHDRVFSREPSGAGKGQTVLVETWVPKV